MSDYTMCLMKERDHDTKEWVLRWRRVPTEGMTPAEVLAWKHQWMGLIVQGFERNRHEKVLELKTMRNGQKALDTVLGLMETRYGASMAQRLKP